MRRHLCAIVLCSAAALAQPAVTAPGLGTVRDSSGGLHTVIGVAGNFIIEETGTANVVSAAFSSRAGLVKTDTAVFVLDPTGQVTSEYEAAGGPALFAFDATGAPALAYYSGTLYQFNNTDLIAVNWTGNATSIALASSGSASAITRHDNQLWNTRIDLTTGNVLNETLLDVSGAALLLTGGGLLFTRDDNIVARDANGVERLMPAAFNVTSFEQMGQDWIAVREAADGTLFALHITPQALELYQLPEVTQ